MVFLLHSCETYETVHLTVISQTEYEHILIVHFSFLVYTKSFERYSFVFSLVLLSVVLSFSSIVLQLCPDLNEKLLSKAALKKIMIRTDSLTLSICLNLKNRNSKSFLKSKYLNITAYHIWLCPDQQDITVWSSGTCQLFTQTRKDELTELV